MRIKTALKQGLVGWPMKSAESSFRQWGKTSFLLLREHQKVMELRCQGLVSKLLRGGLKPAAPSLPWTGSFRTCW